MKCPTCSTEADEHDYNTWYCKTCKLWFFPDPFPKYIKEMEEMQE